MDTTLVGCRPLVSCSGQNPPQLIAQIRPWVDDGEEKQPPPPFWVCPGRWISLFDFSMYMGEIFVATVSVIVPCYTDKCKARINGGRHEVESS